MADDADTPLRLADAVPLACPGASVATLRRERDKGRLTTFILAGKEFTSRRHIRAMHEACRVVPKPAPVSPPRKAVEPEPDGSAALAHALGIAARLKAERSMQTAAARAARTIETAASNPASTPMLRPPPPARTS